MQLTIYDHCIMSNRKTLGSYDIQHLTHKPLQVVLCEHDENSILCQISARCIAWPLLKCSTM
jgi:hypothetical protein